MELILFGFVALTIIVLFFGTAMASLIGKIVEEDSDKIIREAESKYAEDPYRTRHQQIPHYTRPSLLSSRQQSRTSVNKRHEAPTRTDKF